MSTVPNDKFHQLFPDHREPKLPITVYNKLLDTMDMDSAFQILCNVERGDISISEVSSMLSAD